MPIPTQELIAINSLLIEREAAFARIHSAETAINELLGGAFPFQAPAVDLPSQIKQKTKKRKVSKTKHAALKLRRLQGAEVAYRFTFIERGVQKVSEVTDLRSIEPLIKDPLKSMRLLSVETINLDSQTVDRLYAAATE